MNEVNPNVPTKLRCYYCRLDGKDTIAPITLHDRRGCKHVCVSHAKWRFPASIVFGHSPDCAEGRAAASLGDSKST
jgi:hypothetical protein